MFLPDTHSRVLEKLVKDLGEVRWTVFGSVDHALRGFEVTPEDIDILATKRSAARIRDEFERFYMDTSEIGEEVISTVDRYDFDGVEVEVIYSTEDQKQLVDLEEASLQENSMGVPMLSREKIVEIYRMIGRDERADQLESLSRTNI